MDCRAFCPSCDALVTLEKEERLVREEN